LVAEGEVDDAALARGHGSEVVGSSGAANVVGGDGGGGAEFFEAHAALILAVERNFFVLAGGEAKDFEREKFEGAEEFSAAVEKKSGIGSGQVDENFGALPVAVLGQGRVDGDAVFEVEASVGDHGLEEFVDLFGGGEFVGNGHGNLALSSQPSAFSLADFVFVHPLHLLSCAAGLRLGRTAEAAVATWSVSLFDALAEG